MHIYWHGHAFFWMDLHGFGGLNLTIFVIIITIMPQFIGRRHVNRFRSIWNARPRTAGHDAKKFLNLSVMLILISRFRTFLFSRLELRESWISDSSRIETVEGNRFKKVGRVLVYIHVTGYDVDDHFTDEHFTAGCVSPKAKKKENGKEKVEEFIRLWNHLNRWIIFVVPFWKKWQLMKSRHMKLMYTFSSKIPYSC